MPTAMRTNPAGSLPMSPPRTPEAAASRSTLHRRAREVRPIAVVISDDPLERVLLARALVRCGWQVRAVEAPNDVVALANDAPEVGMILLDARRAPAPEVAELAVRQWRTASVLAWMAGDAASIEASFGAPIHSRVLTIDPRSGERALRVVVEAILARVLEREDKRVRQGSCTRPALRVLVVDDDADVRDTLVELLETEGYSTKSASDGAEALAVLRAHSFSAVLLDVRMPTLDGYEFRARQLADPSIADVPVIAVTADHRVEVERLAGAEIVLKPFDVGSLLASIRDRIDRRAAARAAGG